MLLDLKRVFQEDDCRCPFEGTLDLSGEELYGAYPFVSPIAVKGVAENQDRVVALRYSAGFTYSRPCDRCLEQAEKRFELSFEHILAADSEQLSQQLSEAETEQDELIIVSDFKLELDDIVREDVILEMPTKFLCAEDCKGLCPVCGCNLNNSSCDCGTKTCDPRLAALLELLDDGDAENKDGN